MGVGGLADVEGIEGIVGIGAVVDGIADGIVGQGGETVTSFVVVDMERTVTVVRGKEGHLKLHVGLAGVDLEGRGNWGAGLALTRSAALRRVRIERCM